MNPNRPSWLNLVVDKSLLLVAGTILGFVWANLDPHGYDRATHSWHFAVNDIGMVFFFALATKEVFEATLPGGRLASWRNAFLPVAAAGGGMIVPAGIYAALASLRGHPELMRGWAIPCATDIAFSYMVARVVFPRHHPAIPFLLALAIVDDALGLMLLALFFPAGEISIIPMIAVLPFALLLAAGLKRIGVRSFWPYVLAAGTISWAALFWSGIHPALALVPVIPFMPHAERDVSIFDPHEHVGHDTLNRFEHWWRLPVQVVLFFFGLVNAGVPLASLGPGTWFVMVALVVGKPAGIVLFTAAARAIAGGQLPGRDYRDVVVLGSIAGIGFTVALFFATAAFPEGDALNQTKMGALMSFVAAPVAYGLARLVRPRI